MDEGMVRSSWLAKENLSKSALREDLQKIHSKLPDSLQQFDPEGLENFGDMIWDSAYFLEQTIWDNSDWYTKNSDLLGVFYVKNDGGEWCN